MALLKNLWACSKMAYLPPAGGQHDKEAFFTPGLNARQSPSRAGLLRYPVAVVRHIQGGKGVTDLTTCSSQGSCLVRGKEGDGVCLGGGLGPFGSQVLITHTHTHTTPLGVLSTWLRYLDDSVEGSQSTCFTILGRRQGESTQPWP